MSSPKLTRAQAGLIGAHRRWGEQPRVVRLDALTTEQRALVVALIDAAKKAAPGAASTGTAQEVGDAHDITTQPQRS